MNQGIASLTQNSRAPPPAESREALNSVQSKRAEFTLQAISVPLNFELNLMLCLEPRTPGKLGFVF